MMIDRKNVTLGYLRDTREEVHQEILRTNVAMGDLSAQLHAHKNHMLTITDKELALDNAIRLIQSL